VNIEKQTALPNPPADAKSDLSTIPAVILAGGKGVRLQPFTVCFPKPLMPLGNRPILDILLTQLSRAGVRHATLALGHMSSLIRAYITQHAELNGRLKIDFVEETAPTGTAGSLASVPGLNSTFLTMSGDLLTDIDFERMLAAHRHSGATLTIGTHKRMETIDLGILETDGEGTVTAYHEKPTHAYTVSMGVYVYESSVLHYIKPDNYLDFPDLVQTLLRAGEKVNTYCHDGFWLDIGRPDDYARAQQLVAETPERFA
jgi:NDP-sugar pyrophosphorylase family protein